MSRRRLGRCARISRRRFLPRLESLESRFLLAADGLRPPSLGPATEAPLNTQGPVAAAIVANNLAPVLDPIQRSHRFIDEDGVVTVTGQFWDPDSSDTHEIEIDWGGGDGGRPDEGATLITQASQPPGTTLTFLGDGRWQFTAEHRYRDDNPSLTASDSYILRATVTDSAGASSSAGTPEGGNVFLTGHAVLLNDHQAGLDVVMLDYLRNAGQANEIPREDYDIGYLRLNSRDVHGDPGSGLFGTVVEHQIFEIANVGAFTSFLDQIDVLYIPSIWDLGGGAASGTLVAFRPQIEAFFAAGGDLAVETSGPALPSFYSFLPREFDVISAPSDPSQTNSVATSEGVSIGITPEMITAAGSHNHFTQFDNDFTVLEVLGDQAISIGLHSAEVRVDNIAPVLEPVQLDVSSIVEGGQVTVSGTFSDVGLLDTHFIDIDWGDSTTTTVTTAGPNPTGAAITALGDGQWSFQVSHQYADDAPTATPSDSYEIQLTLSDDDTGSDLATAAVVVDNVAPVLDSLVPSATQIAGSAAVTLTGQFFDPGLTDTHTILIDWGGGILPGQPDEGSTTLTTVGPNPVDTSLVDLGDGWWRFTAVHEYLNAGGTRDDYTLTATVTDDDLGIDSLTATISITNVPPELGEVTLSSVEILEGEAVTVSGTFTDPGVLDTHTVVIDWGGGASGQPEQGATVLTTAGPNPAGTQLTPQGDGVWSFQASHTYPDDAPTGTAEDIYRVNVTVADDRGGADRLGEDPLLGNIFVTGHTIQRDDHQEGFDAVILDYLRDAGRANEIAREDYDIGYLRGVLRRDPGSGAFGQVIDAASTSFADAAAFAAFLDQVDVLYIPWLTDVGGELGSAAINSFSAEIEAFLSAGGDLLVEAGADLASFYDFLPATVAVQAEAISRTSGFGISPAGAALGITDSMLDGFEARNRFVSYSDLYSPFQTHGEDTISLGLRGTTVTGGVPVQIGNVAPELADLELSAVAIDPDGVLTVSGSFFDPGLADTHTVVIDWGDGVTRPEEDTTVVITTAGPNPDGTTLTDLGDGNWAFSATHQFVNTPAVPDSYTISVEVADDDTGLVSNSATVQVNNLPPVLEPLTLSAPEIPEEGTVTVSGRFTDRTLDTHTIVIDWGGGSSGQPSEGTTTISTTGPTPAGSTLTDLGNGEWEFTAQHQYLDDNPIGTRKDRYALTATVTDDRGAVSDTQTASGGGNVFLTGHPVMLHAGQLGLDVLILDYLRADGSRTEIARADYDIGYLRAIDRGAPGGNLFGTVVEAHPASFADATAFAAFLDQIDVLYIPWTLDFDGGTGSARLNSFAPQIEAFFAAGGDLAVESGVNLAGFYDFLPPLVAASGPSVLPGGTTTITAAGTATGLRPEMVNGFDAHNTFADFSEDYVVLETLGSEPISIGFQSGGVRVRNVAPSLDPDSLQATLDPNRVATVTGRFTEVGSLDTHAVFVNWGDGSNPTTITTAGPKPPGSSLTDLGGGVWEFTATYEYGSNTNLQDYTISIAVADDDAGVDSLTTTVQVSDAAPELRPLNVTSTVSEGETVTVSGSFLDPGLPNANSLTIDWGEDTTTLSTAAPQAPNAVLTDLGGGEWAFSANFVFADDNPSGTAFDDLPISVTLSDDQGRTATQTGTVRVENVVPLLDPLQLSSTTISEDGVVTVSGTFTDAGVLDSHMLTVDWGIAGEPVTQVSSDGPNPADAIFERVGEGTWRFSASQRYLDDDPTATAADAYQIFVTLTDDDGGQVTGAATLTVENVPPAISAFDLSAAQVDEDGSVVVTGIFSDVGLSDDHVVVINWGGGGAGQPSEGSTTITTSGIEPRESTEDGVTNIRPRNRFRRLTNLGDGRWSFTARHQYLDDAPTGTPQDDYQISITVTDDDGGVDSQARTVTVRNVPPQLGPLEASATVVTEGGGVTVSGTFFDPRLSDTHSVVIDWAAGTGTEGTTTITSAGPLPAGTTLVNLGGGQWEYSASHSYSDDDPTGTSQDVYTIQVSAVDDDSGVATTSTTLTVENVAPTMAPLVLSDTVIVENGTVTLSGTFSDAGLDDTHSLLIDWGVGGQTTQLTSAGPNPDGTLLRRLSGGTWGFSASHQYTSLGASGAELTITATVEDDDLGEAQQTATLTVANDPPTVNPLILSATAIAEGETLTVTGTFFDPDLTDTHTVQIDWGGGQAGQPDEGETTITRTGPNPPQTTFTSLGNGNWRFSATHRYVDDDPTGTGADEYTVTATVTDSQSSVGVATAIVSVNDVGPVVTVPVLSATAIDEGDEILLTGRFSDPGLADTHSVEIDWGGGSLGQLSEGETQLTTAGPNPGNTTFTNSGDGVWTFSATHQYLDDSRTGTASDTYTLITTVTDDDTVPGSAVGVVLVRNVAPEIETSSIEVGGLQNGEATEGVPVTISADFTDVGLLDTHNVRITWGDGDTSDTNSSLTRSDFIQFSGAGGGAGSFTAQHIYESDGLYQINITVTDDDLGSDGHSLQLTVNQAGGPVGDPTDDLETPSAEEDTDDGGNGTDEDVESPEPLALGTTSRLGQMPNRLKRWPERLVVDEPVSPLADDLLDLLAADRP